MRAARWWMGAAVAVASVYACATGSLVSDDDTDSSAPHGDATTGDSAACPQFDLQTDPQHCGSCTNACGSGLLCSNGACKAACESPTTKCVATDGGALCSNLTSDPSHCGSCTNACAAADGGGVTPGPDNPANPGIVYDSGIGWTTGSPSCDASTCATSCTQGFTGCSDGICYDTENHHDHCGACSTACTAQEWCNRGNCCALGQEYCNGACVDVLSNNSNCGACGNACSGGTPTCSNGVCTSAACTPSGSRVAYNTLQSKNATGCFTTSPCATSTYNWSSNNIQSFYNAGEYIVCSGTTACISHVGVNNWDVATECQGMWDVYCDSTKVGTLNTEGKTCSGSPMTNGCSISFSALMCSSVKLELVSGDTSQCCNGTPYDTSLSGVTAW